MVEYHLQTPICEKDVRELKIGDILYVTGDMFTVRDAAHRRALEYHAQGKELPINISGKILFHCGPLVRKTNGEYKIISAGPTTSMRMDMFEDMFIEKFNIHVIVGKGGMGSKTTAACNKFGAIYCAFTGGAGALAAKTIKCVKSVEWLDLGIPEALWFLTIEDFGPLMVAIDSHNRNLYEEIAQQVAENQVHIYSRL
jgi:fumarate hydratase subunit beta